MSGQFNKSLLEFLADEWVKDAYVEELSGHKLFSALIDQSHLYHVIDDTVIIKEVPVLSCKDEESDTPVHLMHVSVAYR